MDTQQLINRIVSLENNILKFCESDLQRAVVKSLLKKEFLPFGYHTLPDILQASSITRKILIEVLKTEGPLSEEEFDEILLWIDHWNIKMSSGYLAHQKNMEGKGLSKFIRSLVHDLRNPLCTAKAASELLVRSKDVEKIQVGFAPLIISSIDRADNMLQELSEVNQVTSGKKLNLGIISCEMKKIIDETLEEYRTAYGEKFIFNSPSQVEGHWSNSGVKKVLKNLLNNAVNYSEPNTSITLNLLQNKDHIQLRIHNQGPTLNSHEQVHAFDVFSRTAFAESKVKKGWGIGLTLSRGIVESLGGILWIESEEGEGVTVVMELPIDSRPFQEDLHNLGLNLH